MFILYRNGMQLAQSGDLDTLIDMQKDLERKDSLIPPRAPNLPIRYEIRAYNQPVDIILS